MLVGERVHSKNNVGGLPLIGMRVCRWFQVTAYYDRGKSAADNLALSFVHGTDKEYNNAANKEGARAYFSSPSRIRASKKSGSMFRVGHFS